MSIRRSIIKNWRSIGEDPGVELELGRITVLAGVNDSGKTAILLGLYGAINSLIYNDTDEYLNEHLHLEGSKHEKNNGKVIDKSSITLITSLSSKAKAYIIGRINARLISNISDPELQNRLMYIVEKYSSAIYEVINHNSNPFEERGEFYFEEVTSHINKMLVDEYSYTDDQVEELTNIFKELRLGLSDSGLEFNFRSFYISPNRQYSVTEQEFMLTKKGKEDTVYLGYSVSELVGFVQQIKTERVKRRGAYAALLDYVQILFPEIVSISVNIPEGMQNYDVYVEWNINGHYKNQPLTRSGSGVVSAIYLAGRLLCNSANTTIGFIDEPETGLHPKLQVRFLKLLRELSSDFGIQWMITTHSPFIMKNLKEEDRLYLIEHDGAETTARAIEPKNKSIVFQAIGAYLPDTIASKGFIFVEGATESTVLPLLLEKCGINAEEEGLVIVPMGGENIYSIPPSDLLKIHPKAMVILDSDLMKPISSGGAVQKKKLNYEQECKSYGVDIYISKDYRTIENMYPKRCMAKILSVSQDDLSYGNFDEIMQIANINKLILAKQIAAEITEEEAREFPLVIAIRKWWES
ncbi:AAA family ATPase [Paenibacillus elgii]|uniref:AAA family ATPase n=1 Tax=Paenibacillus elgii TaxID=189691 RepID=UPI0013D31098|nr:AAA family ATPase [Paenibacillus elgii]